METNENISIRWVKKISLCLFIVSVILSIISAIEFTLFNSSIAFFKIETKIAAYLYYFSTLIGLLTLFLILIAGMTGPLNEKGVRSYKFIMTIAKLFFFWLLGTLIVAICLIRE